MKKKVFIVIVIFAFIAIIASIIFSDNASGFKDAQNMTVVATVNGEKIYRETIDFLIAGYEFSKENASSYSGDTEALNEDLPTEDEVIREQIERIVILKEAEKQGLKADYDEAYQYAEDSYNLAKEIDDENYKLIEAYMEKLDLTEEEYLKLIAESYQNSFTRNNLYKNFIEDKTGTEDELQVEYEKYVDELVKNADIVYE